jgi:hypothetical protein
LSKFLLQNRYYYQLMHESCRGKSIELSIRDFLLLSQPFQNWFRIFTYRGQMLSKQVLITALEKPMQWSHNA